MSVSGKRKGHFASIKFGVGPCLTAEKGYLINALPLRLPCPTWMGPVMGSARCHQS